jgi:hypothetical protein
VQDEIHLRAMAVLKGLLDGMMRAGCKKKP